MTAPTALLALTLLVVAGCGRYGPPERSPQASEAPVPDEEPEADKERERPR